jgi:periplasmic protein TonB
MQTSLFLAFLIALMLHVMGLAVMSFGWQAWRESWTRPEPLAATLIAVTPVPEPTPPPQPETPPEPVSIPDVDSVPEPVPATPPLLTPSTLPKQVQASPPKQVEPRPKPVPVAQTQHPKLPPARERAPRPAPVQREAKASPPSGLRNEPLGSAGSGSPGASPASATSVEAMPQPAVPAEEAGVGQLFARGDMPVAPGSGGSGEGEGSGDGRGRAGTGRGAGGGTGPGRGGGSGNGTGGGSGISARPVGGYQVKPRYPESARRRGIEGTVLLKMRITAQGRVEDVQVVRSAGYPELDESAIEAVRRWRFEPARRNGEPVAEDAVLLPVVFQLQ